MEKVCNIKDVGEDGGGDAEKTKESEVEVITGAKDGNGEDDKENMRLLEENKRLELKVSKHLAFIDQVLYLSHAFPTPTVEFSNRFIIIQLTEQIIKMNQHLFTTSLTSMLCKAA